MKVCFYKSDVVTVKLKNNQKSQKCKKVFPNKINGHFSCNYIFKWICSYYNSHSMKTSFRFV